MVGLSAVVRAGTFHKANLCSNCANAACERRFTPTLSVGGCGLLGAAQPSNPRVGHSGATSFDIDYAEVFELALGLHAFGANEEGTFLDPEFARWANHQGFRLCPCGNDNIGLV